MGDTQNKQANKQKLQSVKGYKQHRRMWNDIDRSLL